MPSNQVAVDPFLLRELSQCIPTSISIPRGYIDAIRRHAHEGRGAYSHWVVAAIEAYAKKTGLKLPEVRR